MNTIQFFLGSIENLLCWGTISNCNIIPILRERWIELDSACDSGATVDMNEMNELKSGHFP